MNPRLRSSFLLICLLGLTSFLGAQTMVRHVSGRLPVLGNSQELGADRPESGSMVPAPAHISPDANAWTLLATIPGAIIHDISFPNAKVGYAVAELGQVWKTTDGGAHWSEMMNLGSPYYWYGVDALSTQDVVISGFYDVAPPGFEGIVRWSHDGGVTWTDDIILSHTAWGQRVRFANSQDGMVMNLVDGAENTASYTTDGGATSNDWISVVDDPSGGWFGLEFSLLPNLRARASGISYCTSPDAGATWGCVPSVDSVFDGQVFFFNNKTGWVGGGEISPAVMGWAHRTTDGGKTWSGRTLNSPWPVRELFFRSRNQGWAAGGNLYTGVGGIYFSRDGGQTWSLDINTHAEMDACDLKLLTQKYQIWCAGYNSSLSGVIYSLRHKR